MKRSITTPAVLAVAVLLLAAGTVQAAPVTVNNFSFEEPDVGNGGPTWSNVTPPGWQEPVTDGGDSFTEEIPGFASEGEQHEGIQNLYHIWQDLGVPAEPLTIYTLTVGVGNRNDSFTFPGNMSRFSLLAGGPTGTVIATRDVDAETLPDGTFADFSVTGVTAAVAPSGNLTIRLEVASTGPEPALDDRAHFDNVRLDATLIPEPSVVGIIGLAACGLMARRSCGSRRGAGFHA